MRRPPRERSVREESARSSPPRSRGNAGVPTPAARPDPGRHRTAVSHGHGASAGAGGRAARPLDRGAGVPQTPDHYPGHHHIQPDLAPAPPPPPPTPSPP